MWDLFVFGGLLVSLTIIILPVTEQVVMLKINVCDEKSTF